MTGAAAQFTQESPRATARPSWMSGPKSQAAMTTEIHAHRNEKVALAVFHLHGDKMWSTPRELAAPQLLARTSKSDPKFLSSYLEVQHESILCAGVNISAPSTAGGEQKLKTEPA